MSDDNSIKARQTQEGTPVDFSCLFRILNWSISLILLAGILGCDVKPKEKPLSLGSFTEIFSPSMSQDGNQLLFTGCGHKDFSQCTIYRFERDSNKLYRYMPQRSDQTLGDGRYSPTSTRFTFSIAQLGPNKELLFDKTQIGIVNQDGSGLRIITQSKGVIMSPALSYDEKSLVFYKGLISDKGSPLRKKKIRMLGSDLYKVDVQTGEETQLTRLAFYGINNLNITSDGKYVVFNGDSPMRLPDSDNYYAVKQFRENYQKKYQGNTIVQYPLDGSGVQNQPEPFFTFDTGAEMPALAKDGSIWFQGHTGQQGWIHYYRRFPDGTMKELPYEMLGLGMKGNALIVLREMAVTPDGSQLATLNENQETGQRYIGVLDTKTNLYTNLTIPATAENITIQ